MKKVAIVLSIIIIIGLVLFTGFYIWGTNAKSKEEKMINFIIDPGTTKTTIAKNLENAGLIRSQYALDIYMILSSPTIQAGEYILSPSMTPKQMIEKFQKGDVKINSATVTLIEGKRITDYAEILDEKYSFTKQEFLKKMTDIDYITSLVESKKYWFLTESILEPSIYYPLEGYLYPDTYEFLETATIEDVVETILSHTEKKLEPLKEQILSNSRSIHELLTMASIVEKEANSKLDRQKASQVFYKRLEMNMSLGSDVTAYYGVNKTMGEELTINELNDNNPYNTRLTDGTMNGKLPIGPICSSDITSIEAALSPTDTNYLYFVANVCTGEVFFQENYQEFIVKVRDLQTICNKN